MSTPGIRTLSRTAKAHTPKLQPIPISLYVPIRASQSSVEKIFLNQKTEERFYPSNIIHERDNRQQPSGVGSLFVQQLTYCFN